MNNLGKILLILIIPILLNAKVSLKAPSSFYKGDVYSFSITASGGDVKFPDIKNINGMVVKKGGTSSQTRIINGVRSQNITKTYLFMANKNFTLPSFTVTIDGKAYKTKAKKVIAKKVNKTVSPYYSLDIEVDKKDIYVSQELRFKLTFKYRKDLQIVDLEFMKPDFENFWVKELQQNQQKSQGNYIVQELNYILFPQKSGKLSIEPLKIGVVVVDDRGTNSYGFFRSSATKTIPVYSNSINLDVKPLPKDIKLVGDFSISASVDKKTINEGDAVSYKISLKGRGNIDDIDELPLSIKGAVVYDNPAKKEFDIKANKYGGEYFKTYSIVASKDLVIPPMKLSYFDLKTKSVKHIQTKAFDIKVKQIKKKEQAKLQTLDETSIKKEEKTITKVVQTSDKEKLLFFFLGVLVTSVVFAIVYFFKNRKNSNIKDETILYKEVKKTKTKGELLKLLVVYINIDKELDKIIYLLENNDLKDDFKSIKKETLAIVKDKKLDINL